MLSKLSLPKEMHEFTGIGNDIIDLKGFQSDLWNTIRYQKKILLSQEVDQQKTYKGVCYTEVLFSCKEAAYKYFVGKGLRTAFNPRAFLVLIQEHQQSSTNNGFEFISTVSCELGYCVCKSQMQNDAFVHSVCTASGRQEDVQTCIRHSERLSLESEQERGRNVTIDFLRTTYGLENADIIIIKDPELQIPEVFEFGNRSPIRISMSHDGRFVAAAAIK
jgi:phosphopantetheinyl transferase (holo-ACP synthase)